MEEFLDGSFDRRIEALAFEDPTNNRMDDESTRKIENHRNQNELPDLTEQQ